MVFLVVGGREEEIKELKNKAEELKVSDRVVFVGRVEPSKVHEYVKASDILVHYSAESGNIAALSPLKLFEYMLSGRPLTAPDYPYVREILEDGVEGYLFNHQNPSSLAELIRWIVNNYERALETARRARRKAETSYTYEARARKIITVILNES